MAQARIGALRVDLGINTAAFNTGLGQAQGKVVAFGGSMRRLTAPIQQAAFQIGDFATQVGAGTKASVALGQQLPQLLGAFGVFGAVLGTVAAIAVPLFRDTFEDGIAKVAAMAKEFARTNSVIQSLGTAFGFLADNIDHVAVAAASLAAVMAGRWVVGFVAARVATISLAGALTFLRAAIIKTGIGVLIVGAGELVYGFLRLVKATGGWGNALQLLGEVAAGVWDGIKTSAASIPPALGSVWEQVKADFFGMLSDIAGAWGDFANSLAGKAGAAGLNGLQSALTDLRDSADQFSTEMGEAWDGAFAKADQLSNLASGKLSEGFGKAAEAVKRLRISSEETAKALGGESEGGTGSGGAAGSSKKVASALEDAATASQKINDAWQGANDSISSALQSLTTGQNVMGSLGGAITGIANSAFGADVKASFDALAKSIGDKIKGAISTVTRGSGLSGPAVAGVGTGIATAAVGVLNRDSSQIGSGIGSAAGAAIGSFIPGIGTALGAVLGGVAGGFLSKVFGGGDDDKWKRVAGTAFSGTSFAQSVTTSRTLNTQTDQGLSPEGRLAFQATRNILANFNAEIAEYVESIGGTVARGARVVVNQTAALKAITGAIEEGEISYKGEAGKLAGEQISAKVTEIMGLAATLVQGSGHALTQAQVLWRETQKKFSAENVAILKDLGFAASQIAVAQKRIKDELAQGFELELLQGLADSGRATGAELRKWREAELEDLKVRRQQAFATAKEIGASRSIVSAAFKAQFAEIGDQYREMLGDMQDATRAALQGRQDALNQKRAGILGELAKRSEDALRAEEALRNARAGLAGGSLNPGTAQDRFGALQQQFADAINSAMRGNADAANDASRLAGDLLEAGRGIFASGTDYATLFKDVNSQLVKAQEAFDARADRIGAALDQDTYKDVSERHTKSLLTGLERLNASIEAVEKKIEAQTRELRASSQKASVGR